MANSPDRDTYLRQLEAQGICPSCGGFGDHGPSDEDGDLGRPYICFACGGTGKCEPVPLTSLRLMVYQVHSQLELWTTDYPRQRLAVAFSFTQDWGAQS